nr:hypothetical protein [Mycobacterium sp. E3298]
MNETHKQTRKELSEAEHKARSANDDLRVAQKAYTNSLIEECIEGIIKIKKESGDITEFDLKIFINDLVSKVKDIR